MKVSEDKVFIPAGDKLRKSSLKIANAMAIELENCGIQASLELIMRIATHKKEDAKNYCTDILKKNTIGDVNPPLFPDWESRKDFTFGEFVFQIMGYMVQLSGNDLADANYMVKLRENARWETKKKIKLASDKKARVQLEKLLSANVSQDRDNLRNLQSLANNLSLDEVAYIRSDEARVTVANALTKNRTLLQVLSGLKCKPTDTLRISAAKRDPEIIKLPHDVKYANLSWRNRLDIMSFLARFSFEELSEAMGSNRTAWTRFSYHLHLLQQKEFLHKFPHVILALYVAQGCRLDKMKPFLVPHYKKYSKLIDLTESGSLAYRTFASRIKSAVERQDFDTIKELIEQRPGYLMRNLTTVSNGVTEEHHKDFDKLLKKAVKRTQPGALLSIIGIDTNTPYRIIDAKGTTTVQPANYGPAIDIARKRAKKEIKRRYGLNGRIEVEDGLENEIVPFLAKNSELARGSTIPFQDKKYLYFFVHWVQPENNRTDLDHSYFCINHDGTKETIAFYNQANDYLKQSGDITNAPAPKGGTEYGRIDLNEVPKGVKYIVPNINVFCGQPFSENVEAYAGFQFSDSPSFCLQQEHTRYDLAEPAQFNVPFVIDAGNREVRVVDYNQADRKGAYRGSIALNYYDDVEKILQSSQKPVTIGKLAKLLGGKDAQFVLRIKLKAMGDGEIEPGNLFGLFSS